MAKDLADELLNHLPPVASDPGQLGNGPDTNLLETHLLKLAGITLNEETEKLRELLDALKKR